MTGEDRVVLLDPCAGEGTALTHLTRHVAERGKVRAYAVEMEETRAEKAKEVLCEVSGWGAGNEVLVGDAFRASFSEQAAHLLFLNPPYDHDREHGRLEQRFLERFTSSLVAGGILLFLVPHYSLTASAEHLSTEYEVLGCWRFPDPDFAQYKQVVLAARRLSEPLQSPDAAALKLVGEWASNPLREMPELPRVGDEPPVELPATDRWRSGFTEWRMRTVDYGAVCEEYRVWYRSEKTGALRVVPNTEPQQPLASVLDRTYPLATPPRPAHIAAGIASGLFNGARVEPKDPRAPSLLVKGVFDREYKTVDEKTNKDGAVTALVQVQQPRLVVTALDLRSRAYYVLGQGDERCTDPAAPPGTVADLLDRYGDSLMSVMRRQCPVLYDPKRDAGESLRQSTRGRRLYPAQADAARAVAKVFAERSRVAILLGEIGVGKSTTALVAARTAGAKRILVLCPPHLLRGWQNEVEAALPGVPVFVLREPRDVDVLLDYPVGKSFVAVLSREAAKLGHSWADVTGACPRCGSALPKGDLAKRRARCEAEVLVPADEAARFAVLVAWRLGRVVPGHPTVEALLQGRHAERARKVWSEAPAGDQRRLWSREDAERVAKYLLDNAAGDRSEHAMRDRRAVLRALHAAGDHSLTLDVARRATALEGDGSHYDSFCRSLALMLPPGSPEQAEFARAEEARRTCTWGAWSRGAFGGCVREFAAGKKVRAEELDLSWEDGVLSVNAAGGGTIAAATGALSALAASSKWKKRGKCGEFLFQASAPPMRYSLAKYIARCARTAFDFLICDEAHENSGDGSSAQSHAAQRLQQLSLPTIQMTGTVMNGYASSLFTNMWMASEGFRLEFKRDERSKYVDRYGYRKQVVEDHVEGKVVEFGSHSDRVVRSERVVGDAPGILPLFLLRHLLPIAVTLHKSDLALDLPPLKQHAESVEPTPEMARRYKRLLERLLSRIKSDRFSEEGLSGKLFGQLAEVPSYLDRCTSDVGNCEGGDFEIRYPEAVGGALVASEGGLDPSELLPKEKWLVEKLRAELAEGRRAMVFGWHLSLLPRLSRVIERELGERATILWADKVPTAKRQDWIDREVVQKGVRVMVANPVAIQTGLNNLVHFSTEIWVENPAVNGTIYRQAVGRIDRIGQTKDSRVFFPVYSGTLQEALRDLLLRKAMVSTSTDGLDPESMLEMAGIGEQDHLAALSIGRQLWKRMGED